MTRSLIGPATRNRMVDLLLRTGGGVVLNPHAAGASVPPEGPAAAVTGVMRGLLQGTVDPTGRHVDYESLARSPLYLEMRGSTLAALRTMPLDAAGGREAALAFWINLYNLLVLDAVVQFGIRKSVTEGVAGLLRFFRRAAYLVGGQRFSLEEIEHGVLRANRGHPYLPGRQFDRGDPRHGTVVTPFEPRIHFALNCASRSCPPLRLFERGAVDDQLSRASADFLQQSTRLDRKDRTLTLSRIFQWFQGDFGGRAGVIDFVTTHWPDEAAVAWLAAHREGVRLAFDPYDWSLNR